MDRKGGAGAGDRGETLIELLVALTILGIAGVAILAGVMTSIRASTVHGNEARGGAFVRSFAEAVQSSVDAGGYKATCAAATNVTNGYAAVAVVDFPTGYSRAVTACTELANGIQKVTLTVTSTGDSSRRAVETLAVIIRKPCNGNASSQGDDPCA